MNLLAKYNTAFTIPFALHALDGKSLQTGAAHAAGDTILMKDEGAEANTTNGFVDRGSGYSIQLTATEMTAARLLLMVDDQTVPKVWLPRSFQIFTFGNVSAHLPFDLGTAVQQVDVTKVNGDSNALLALFRSLQGYIVAQAATGTLTSTEFTSTLTQADDFHYNKLGVFVTGALAGAGFRVRQSKQTSGRLIVTQLPGSPSNNDFFVLY